LRTLGVEVDLVAASPLLRAQETAEIVAKLLEYQEPLEIWEELTPASLVPRTLERLQSCQGKESVLLVGHQPHLGYLASYLLFGSESVSLDFKKGGVCAIHIERVPVQPPVELLWMLPPKILRLLGDR